LQTTQSEPSIPTPHHHVNRSLFDQLIARFARLAVDVTGLDAAANFAGAWQTCISRAGGSELSLVCAGRKTWLDKT
jgi:hypothetical protein